MSDGAPARYLLISPYFPPMSRMGAKRALHLCRNLPTFGWEPVVLAAPPRDGHVDPGLMDALPAGTVVSRGYAGTLRSFAHRAIRFEPMPFEEVPHGKATRLRERRILGQDIGFLTPLDQYVYDLPAAVREGVALVRRHGLKAIQVSADPWSGFLTGWLVRRATGLPLVLDMRDPWSLHAEKMALRPAPSRAAVRWLEHAAFKRASRIVLNNANACAAYRAAYRGRIPESRFTFVRNAFDLGLFAPPQASLPAAFRLLYFGRFQRFVRPHVLLRAFRRFVDREGLAPADARLAFAGGLRRQDKAPIEELGLEDRVDYVGYVPYRDGLDALRSAHVLCLIVPPSCEIQIPGKFYDYLAARRPILALSANDEVDRIIAETGSGLSAGYADEEGAAARLAELYQRHRRGESFDLDPAAVEAYSAREQARALAAILDDVTS